MRRYCCTLVSLLLLEQARSFSIGRLPRSPTQLRATIERTSTDSAGGNLMDFNQHLNELAEQCSDPTRCVVAIAADCESLWRNRPETDVVSLNSVLKAWARVSQTFADNRDHRAMLDTNTPVYTSKDAAERATALLHNADQYDVQSYNVVLDAWAKSRCSEAPQAVETLMTRLKEEEEDMHPDRWSYNAVVDTYAYSSVPNRIEILHSLWKEMQQNDSLKATVRTLNSILHAYSRMEDPKYAQMAINVLRQAQERFESSHDPADQPDVMTYTTVLDALARCASPETTEQAVELFNELKQMYAETKNDRFRPSIYTYVTMMVAWSRTPDPRAPKECEALLREAMSQKDMAVNHRAFNTVIQSWARSRDGRKAAKALQLVKEMRALGKEQPAFKPSILTYNAAIDACSRTRGSAEQEMAALKIAFALFQAAEQDGMVSHTTYATLIRATSYLLPPGDERNKVAQATWEKAVAAAQADLSVVKQLQRCVDSTKVQELLEPMVGMNGHIDFDRLPHAWKKNVQN